MGMKNCQVRVKPLLLIVCLIGFVLSFLSHRCHAWRGMYVCKKKLQKVAANTLISTVLLANSHTIGISQAKVDATPLDIDKLSKASYRGHIKFEIVGLKKLIKNGEYMTIHKEIEHYKPLFEANALKGKTDSAVATEAEVEGIRVEFTNKFKELDELTTTATATEADAEKAYSLYLAIEQSFSGIVKAYGSTAAPL